MPKALRSSSRRTKSRHGKTPRKARVISSPVVYRGPVFWVTTDKVEEPGGIRVRRELIQKRLVALSVAVRMVVSGTIRDAKTISSILWLQYMNEHSLDSKTTRAKRRR